MIKKRLCLVVLLLAAIPSIYVAPVFAQPEAKGKFLDLLPDWLISVGGFWFVPNLCGNGVLDPGESCDDGNRIDRDGCSRRCHMECVQARGIPVAAYHCPATCGNNILEVGEECDQGPNNTDNPGISGERGTCRKNCHWARCGDHIRDTGEQCDGSLGCPADCRFDPPPLCDDKGNAIPTPGPSHGVGVCPGADEPWTVTFGETDSNETYADVAVDSYRTVYTITKKEPWTSVWRQLDACGGLFRELSIPDKYPDGGIDIDRCGNSYLFGEKRTGPLGLSIVKINWEGASDGEVDFNVLPDTWADERAGGVAIDRANGRLYVVGTTGHFGEGCAFLRRYDLTAASMLYNWGKIFDGSGEEGHCHSISEGAGVAVGPDGSVFITGKIEDRDSEESLSDPVHLWVAKYSPAGTLLWSKDWREWSQATDGPPWSLGYDITTDLEGNAYVSLMASRRLGTDPVLVAAKFSPEGTLLTTYTRTYDQPHDAYGIAVDADGDIFLAGRQSSIAGGIDNLWAGKFENDFDPLWENLREYPLDRYIGNEFENVVLDAEGFAYFIGRVRNPPPGAEPGFYLDMTLEKYRPGGP